MKFIPLFLLLFSSVGFSQTVRIHQVIDGDLVYFDREGKSHADLERDSATCAKKLGARMPGWSIRACLREMGWKQSEPVWDPVTHEKLREEPSTR